MLEFVNGTWTINIYCGGVEKWYSIRETENAKIEDFENILAEYEDAYHYGQLADDPEAYLNMLMFDTMEDLEGYLIEEI